MDSFAYTGASLDNLVKRDDNQLFKTFNEEFQNINPELEPLLKLKGSFPYDSKDKLNEQLPTQEEFYNKLNDCHISDKEYERAKNVYNLAECKTFKNYLDLYLKTDVILLADVMENFRNVTYD